ncbi:serine/threonine-protein kinase [Chondromyces crocatus]|uniref:Protein kinase domain-containing protein n=1 Tax=Chondromyces crocatus TaxID=52 RepID=A0A0K1EQ99_CHOCO|nr:serine/threonine-protein kinase [Chondromyces crocatus]AKT42994.1 uncharacterized protein CMC5_072210 [Chondromyces crocatus]
MSPPLDLGDTIAGVYRLERVLGRGGMGIVYAATHLPTQVVRAVKVMLPEAARHPRAVKSFLSESWTACALQGEHVVRVLDVGEHRGLPFMAMELLEGRDLGAVLAERKALPAPEAAHYALQICEALTEAHVHGVVHRDIKPENVFLAHRPDGTTLIKVLDFGLAKVEAIAFPAGSATPRASLIGSPCFMSPEQILGDEIDGRSDLWSLGVLLYRMVTSQLPFRSVGRVGIASLLAAILKADPMPPAELLPSIPAGLAAIILRCLDKNRDARYGSAPELAMALAPFAPPEAAPTLARLKRAARSDLAPPVHVPRLPIPPVGLRRSSIPPAGLVSPSIPPAAATRISAPPPSKPGFNPTLWSTVPPPSRPGFNPTLWSTVPPPSRPAFNDPLWSTVPPPSVPLPPPRHGGARHAMAFMASASLLAAASSLGVDVPRTALPPSPATAEAGIAAQVRALLAALRAPERPIER